MSLVLAEHKPSVIQYQQISRPNRLQLRNALKDTLWRRLRRFSVRSDKHVGVNYNSYHSQYSGRGFKLALHRGFGHRRQLAELVSEESVRPIADVPKEINSQAGN